MKSPLLVLIAMLLLSRTEELSESPRIWNYVPNSENGPNQWGAKYVDCKKDRQSPINIIDADIRYKRSPKLEFSDSYYNDTPSQFVLKNIGFSVQTNMPENPARILKGGDLPSTFRLMQFHLHWGQENKRGSEHSINGKFYAMEIHLVHVNEKFATTDEALKAKDGLAVLGIMVEIGKRANPGFQKLVDILHLIKYDNQSGVVNTSFSLFDLMPCNLDAFYRYAGSLTTPPCYETVIWTIFKEPFTVSAEQVEAFRKLSSNVKGDDFQPIAGNMRPLQPLKDRIVLRSFIIEKDLSASPSIGSFSTLTILLLSLGAIFLSGILSVDC